MIYRNWEKLCPVLYEVLLKGSEKSQLGHISKLTRNLFTFPLFLISVSKLM
jgi:hypothetical protein